MQFGNSKSRSTSIGLEYDLAWNFQYTRFDCRAFSIRLRTCRSLLSVALEHERVICVTNSKLTRQTERPHLNARTINENRYSVRATQYAKRPPTIYTPEYDARKVSDFNLCLKMVLTSP